MVLPIQSQQSISLKIVGNNVWFGLNNLSDNERLASLSLKKIDYEILETEEAVGRAMFGEIERAVFEKQGDLVIVILGGRGAQALHRLMGQMALTNEKDELFARLNVFTQDALAPMKMDSGLVSFVILNACLAKLFSEKSKALTQCEQTPKI